jgi:hypothetical protein
MDFLVTRPLPREILWDQGWRETYISSALQVMAGSRRPHFHGDRPEACGRAVEFSDCRFMILGNILGGSQMIEDVIRSNTLRSDYHWSSSHQ